MFMVKGHPGGGERAGGGRARATRGPFGETCRRYISTSSYLLLLLLLLIIIMILLPN